MYKLKTHNVILLIHLLSIFCYSIGLYYPVIHTTKFIFFNKDISLFESVVVLWNSSEYFLAVIVCLFTLLIPSIKLFLILFYFIGVVESKRILKFISLIGKWSMLDVFLIAVLIFSFKTSSMFMQAKIGNGLFFLAASIILNISVTVYLTNIRFAKSNIGNDE